MGSSPSIEVAERGLGFSLYLVKAQRIRKLVQEKKRIPNEVTRRGDRRGLLSGRARDEEVSCVLDCRIELA